MQQLIHSRSKAASTLKSRYNMASKSSHLLKVLLKAAFLACLLSPLSLWALESDREQSINIKADAGIVDELSGVTIYTGTVTIDQGTLHIAADEVKVISDDKEVVQIIASMSPSSAKLAHYEQLPEQKSDLIYADAKMITYFLQEERLHLAGDAQLKQTNDFFSGELLHYDMAKRIVELKSSGKKNDARVNIILEPKKKD